MVIVENGYREIMMTMRGVLWTIRVVNTVQSLYRLSTSKIIAVSSLRDCRHSGSERDRKVTGKEM